MTIAGHRRVRPLLRSEVYVSGYRGYATKGLSAPLSLRAIHPEDIGRTVLIDMAGRCGNLEARYRRGRRSAVNSIAPRHLWRGVLN